MNQAVHSPAMKPDPNLTEEQQIAVYDAEIRRNLWQVALLAVFIVAAILKGYTLHVEESISEAENQVAFAQDLLNACQASLQQATGTLKSAAACADRQAAVDAATSLIAGAKASAFNAFALSVFGSESSQNSLK